MPRVNLEQFKERVEKGKAIPALLLLGDEFYLRDACRAALIRAIARFRSNSGLVLSPVESSIDRPASPVLTARATFSAISSGSTAKPPSKSALTGMSTAELIAAR